MEYDFSTAKAVCNDQQLHTWEVQVRGTDGQWYVVSDSSEMTEADAVLLAACMVDDANLNGDDEEEQ